MVTSTVFGLGGIMTASSAIATTSFGAAGRVTKMAAPKLPHILVYCHNCRGEICMKPKELWY